MPSHYYGEVWPDYYAFLYHHRDSDILTDCNFEVGVERLGGEKDDEETGDPLVCVVREGHDAVGWVEWIAIHESQEELLIKANEMLKKLEGYPVLSEDKLSEKEQEEADRIWKENYNERERIEYMRENYHSAVSFRDLRDQVRGKYFGGYANELVY